MMLWQARISCRVALASWVEWKEDVVINMVLKHLNEVRRTINPTEPELVWDNTVRAIIRV